MTANPRIAFALGLSAITRRDPGSRPAWRASRPIARYDMRAGTVSGIGVMDSGKGGGLSMAFVGGVLGGRGCWVRAACC